MMVYVNERIKIYRNSPFRREFGVWTNTISQIFRDKFLYLIYTYFFLCHRVSRTRVTVIIIATNAIRFTITLTLLPLFFHMFHNHSRITPSQSNISVLLPSKKCTHAHHQTILDHKCHGIRTCRRTPFHHT